jgi:hypothetical protein
MKTKNLIIIIIIIIIIKPKVWSIETLKTLKTKT